MKKILVPTDFSPNANKALDYALHIAAACGARIDLLHVLGRTQTLDVEKLMLPYNADSESIKLATQQIETLISAAQPSGVPMGWELYNGSPADSIAQAIDDMAPDLVIMGTLGDSGTKGKLFGSITAKLIGNSSKPVLAVPLLANLTEWNHILVSIKDFAESESHLKLVFDLSKGLQTAIHLSIFVDEDDDLAAEYIQKNRDLSFYSQKIGEENPKLEIIATPLHGKVFEETINRYITENNSSILVMVTHKRNFIERILDPSLTRQMSYHTNIPLLAIPV